jgi:aryl sulfotransferase
MSEQLPKRIHIYQNHILDSPRWDHYKPREGDIVIASSYKSGTTWMQGIVLNLILLGQELPLIEEVSPWLEVIDEPTIDEVVGRLDAQEHRRFIKTHLPLDGIPYYRQLKYIVMGRDPRDVFMSLWNHYSNYTEEFIEWQNSIPGRVGPPLPRCPEDIHEFWLNWITRGWFEWEVEGYPFWGNMRHTQTWWDYRTLKNILFVHFNDLLSDTEEEICRVAHFLDIALSDASAAAIVQEVSLLKMRKNAEKGDPDEWNIWKDGAKTFFFKGTYGRWKGVLSPEEIALYKTTASKVLTSDCARWLEQGRAALT